ncbi:hypothetical protein GGG16DRAFT_64388 [Schizophyllum commune]
MGRYRTGVKRCCHQRGVWMNAVKAAKRVPDEKENISPDGVALKEVRKLQERCKELEKETHTRKVTTMLLRESLKNALDREKRWIIAKEAYKLRLAEKSAGILDMERKAEERLRGYMSDNKYRLGSLQATLQRVCAELEAATEANLRMHELYKEDEEKLEYTRHTLDRLQETVARASVMHSLITTHAPSLPVQMKIKHAYAIQIRALVRTLVAYGCSESKVGAIIQNVAAAFGIIVPKRISRRSAGRMVLEGLMMARVQLGQEMQKAIDITFSGDSTSRRNQNYQSHHATYRTQVFELDKHGILHVYDRIKTRFMGILSTLDHSSARSLDAWMQILIEVTRFYNSTPLRKRLSDDPLNAANILVKLRGMSSDHASGEKATAAGMKEAKQEATLMQLGLARREEMPLANFQALLASWNQRKFSAVGGTDAWNALSAEERAARDLATVNAVVREIGEQELDALPEDERRLLTLFIWTGCCMHKDQNAFKGGNSAMIAAWDKLGLTPPILLANKANAATVRTIVAPEAAGRELTEEELAAVEVSTRGGAKTTALAGAIFHHRSDKKGQGDTYVNVLSYMLSEDFEQVIHRFPQTNNTRFGSHGEAAGELLVHLEYYIEFLEFIRTKKQSVSWTNIELNVYNALHDDPTLTELAVLALYQQLITHPYMKLVRLREGDELNAADLGPLHAEIREHCQRLIDHPEIILDFAPRCYVDATFDGQPFHRVEVVDAVHGLVKAGRLPHLSSIFVSFLKGALVTWIRFSSEYAPGGLIDGMSADEHTHIFLNATNDRNEGALGAWCVWSREHPTSTIQQHNALAMYIRNETEKFVQAYFTDEDYLWAMRTAREYDASGIERKRRREQAAFEVRMVEMKRARIATREAKKAAKRGKLAAVLIVSSEAAVDKLSGTRLTEQYDKLRAMWGPRLNVLGWSKLNVARKKVALVGLLRRHRQFLQDGEEPAEGEDTATTKELLEVTLEPWFGEEDDGMDTEED